MKHCCDPITLMHFIDSWSTLWYIQIRNGEVKSESIVRLHCLLAGPPHTSTLRFCSLPWFFFFVNFTLMPLFCYSSPTKHHPRGYIGSSIKSCSIKHKTKCKKKWRWSCRLMKTWHIYNNNIVNLFAKKLIQNLHFYSRYGIFYV